MRVTGQYPEMLEKYGEANYFEKNHGRYEYQYYKILLHHVLDVTFREDRSPARKSKNNLALIRKFAYNILKLAMMKGPKNKTMPEMMDDFADDHSLIEEYVIRGIASFY